MVKCIFLLSLALVLQYTTITQAAEPDSAPRNTDAILAKLKVDIELARNQTGIPGMSVAIMHKGKLIFAEGFGKRNKHDPFTPETHSMLGSVTKAFTATTVGELVAEGKMDWDTTPVNTYLPEFETIDPILTSQLTMQDLLSHRTTFPNIDAPWVWGTKPRREFIKRIRHVETKSKLGVAMNYNNVMYAVAGEAAANVAGVTLEQLVHDKVFKPLGLSNTGFSMAEMTKNKNFAMPNYAASYEDAVAGRFIETPLDAPAKMIAAAGDMYATVLDLVRWGQTVLNEGMVDGKQVLSKEGIAATLTAHTIYNPALRDPDFGLSVQYGMGWFLKAYKGNNFYEHSGSTSGYISDIAVFPNAELVVAVLTNSHMSAVPAFLYNHVADELLGLRKSQDWLAVTAVEMTKKAYARRAMEGKDTFPKQIPSKPLSHELSAYAGDYFHPGYGPTTVRLEGGQLHMTLEAFEGVLTHYHFDTFTTVLSHTEERFNVLVTFNTGADAKVASVSFAAPLSRDVATYTKK
ncbi:hypothetical protein BGZ92_007896 [Podila epicladia]|nr:hypothetical protein BGZ92_007896 [Podila epicladia]